jgi:integrase
LRLRVSDIDFDNCRFKGYNGGNPVYIPLDSISMLAIKRYLEEERPKGVRTDILLLSRLGNPLLKWGIVQILNKYQDKIDFNLDCRTLRLSGLAIWYLSGMKIEDILRRGGYKDSPRQRYRVQRDINDIIG